MTWKDIKILLPDLKRVEVLDVEVEQNVGEDVVKYKLSEDPHFDKKGIWIRDEVAEDNATKNATADAPSQAEASATPSQETCTMDSTKPAISGEDSMTNKGSADATSTKDEKNGSIVEEKEPIDNGNDAPTPTTQEAVAAPTTQETVVNQSETTEADPRLVPPTTDSQLKAPLQQVSPPIDSDPQARATQETANMPDTTEPTPIPPTTDPSKLDTTINEPKNSLQPVAPETDKHAQAPTAQMTPADQPGTATEDSTPILDTPNFDSQETSVSKDGSVTHE